MKRSHAMIYVCVAVVVAFGCDPDDACDPGYFADHGTCYPIMVDADAGDDDAGDADRYLGFGDACDTHDDCGPNAPSCGQQPFQVCTLTNCMELGAGACPPTWTCLDVTAFSPDPNITSACVKL